MRLTLIFHAFVINKWVKCKCYVIKLMCFIQKSSIWLRVSTCLPLLPNCACVLQNLKENHD